MVDLKSIEEDPFMSPASIAKLFGVKPYTVRMWLNEDPPRMKSHKLDSGRLAVRRSEVERYVQKIFGSEEENPDDPTTP